jgi:hypothetical protein
MLQPEVEAILQHVGLRTWDLILVDVEGRWIREEYPSVGSAEAACRSLGTRVSRGWEDGRLVRRMGRRDQWGTPDGQRRGL